MDSFDKLYPGKSFRLEELQAKLKAQCPGSAQESPQRLMDRLEQLEKSVAYLNEVIDDLQVALNSVSVDLPETNKAVSAALTGGSTATNMVHKAQGGVELAYCKIKDMKAALDL